MSEVVPHCCYIEPNGPRCGAPAEWNIHERNTDAEHRDHSVTQSCTRHVGDMLGHAGEPRPGKVPYYEVYPI